MLDTLVHRAGVLLVHYLLTVACGGCCTYAVAAPALAADVSSTAAVQDTAARSSSAQGASTLSARAAAVAEADGFRPVDPSTYVPGPVEVGWEIWFGAIIATIPFVIGAYEFGKRIVSDVPDQHIGSTYSSFSASAVVWAFPLQQAHRNQNNFQSELLCFAVSADSAGQYNTLALVCLACNHPPAEAPVTIETLGYSCLFTLSCQHLGCVTTFMLLVSSAAHPAALPGVWRQWAGAAWALPAQVPPVWRLLPLDQLEHVPVRQC
jgi:hypothetical protein